MAFNTDTVDKIANLSRISISDEKKQQFISEMDGIIEWINQLQEVDVSNVEPLYSTSVQENVWRSDMVTTTNLQKELTANAPESVHGFYVVPKMVE